MVIDSSIEALELMAQMTWDSWWALVLGFALSGIIEAFVSEEAVSRALGDDGSREVALGAALGAATSSCSYSAVGTAKTVFKKGGSGVAALGAFMFASTDLVIELGLAVWVLLGWQFLVGEYVGGIIAVIVIAGFLKYAVPTRWFEDARERLQAADEYVCATCNSEVDPDDVDAVSLQTASGVQHFCCTGCRGVFKSRQTEEQTTFTDRLTSVDAWQSAARAATKDWEMLWDDIAIGFILAGLVAAFVPASWWGVLFASGNSLDAVTWNVSMAILIGVVTVMCSVGNIPFAVVLWRNGLPFGGVLSFIYADLLIPPLVRIYHRYYGTRVAAALVVALTLGALVAGVLAHYLLAPIAPASGELGGTMPDNYTTILNFVLTPVFIGQIIVTYGIDGVTHKLKHSSLRAAGLVVAALVIARIIRYEAADLAADLREPAEKTREASGLLAGAGRDLAATLGTSRDRFVQRLDNHGIDLPSMDSLVPVDLSENAQSTGQAEQVAQHTDGETHD